VWAINLKHQKGITDNEAFTLPELRTSALICVPSDSWSDASSSALFSCAGEVELSDLVT